MTETMRRIALLQMTSGIDPAANLACIDAAMGAAAAGGAVMLFLPEMAVLLDRDRARGGAHITREADSPWPGALGAMARRHGLWLHAGSLPFVSDDGTARVNRSLVLNADGAVAARYDKIHRFDVDLPGGESWRESALYQGGAAAIVVDTPLGRMGLTICFDLRFAELYTALADAGADVIAVPAAFTVPSGLAHWHVLLRARAIETGCHIVAAAQTGQHDDGRATFGHSLVVDPWGQIVAEADGAVDDPGGAPSKADKCSPHLLWADMDGAASERARRAIPLDTARANRRWAPPAA